MGFNLHEWKYEKTNVARNMADRRTCGRFFFDWHWTSLCTRSSSSPSPNLRLTTDDAAERTEYQTKMRALKTDKERDAFRTDHHDKMTVRAAEKGVTLPSAPTGVGAGPKTNSGLGVGSGSGMGAGQGSPAGGGKGPGR